MRVAKGYRRGQLGPHSRASSQFLPQAGKSDSTAQGSIRTPGIEHPGRVELGLGGAQGGGERGRALAVIPGPVIAADRVVVGDRAAAVDQRLGDRRLDLVPLLDLAAAHRRREHREVGRGAVGVDVGEAAADAGRAGALARHPAGLGDRGARRLHHRRVELLEPVPGDRRLEGLREHAAGDEGVAQVGRQQEAPRHAPTASSRLGPLRLRPVGRDWRCRRAPRRSPGRSPGARRPGGGRTRSRGSGGCAPPSPAPVSSASAASSRRQLEG